VGAGRQLLQLSHQPCEPLLLEWATLLGWMMLKCLTKQGRSSMRLRRLALLLLLLLAHVLLRLPALVEVLLPLAGRVCLEQVCGAMTRLQAQATKLRWVTCSA
jgi:hypothetical protein